MKKIVRNEIMLTLGVTFLVGIGNGISSSSSWTSLAFSGYRKGTKKHPRKEVLFLVQRVQRTHYSFD